MTTVVLLFHPNLDASTVNARLAEAARSVNDVIVRDMYALYPDFAIDAAAEQKVLETADRIVFQFPMYWYSSPALLKQWEDTVLAYGWAYGTNGTALHGKQLMIAVSPGAPANRYGSEGMYRYTVEELLRPFETMTVLTGLEYTKPFITIGAQDIADADLDAAAAAYSERLSADEWEPARS